MNLKKILKLALLLLFSVFYSCKQSDNSKSAQEINLTNNQTETIDNQNNFNFELPPVDLLFDLKKIEFDYLPGVTNPPNQISKYSSQRSKMLNLGIYFADFSYLSTIGETALLPNYLENIKFLTDELKIVGLFDESTINKFKNNFNNPDLLYEITIEFNILLMEKLNATNREATLQHVSIGGFIETFYLFIQPFDDKSKYMAIASELENYQYVFNEYFKQAQKLSSNPFLGETVSELDGLITILDKLKIKRSQTVTTELDSNKIHISGGESYQINYEDFKAIKAEVEKIRTHFVSLN